LLGLRISACTDVGDESGCLTLVNDLMLNLVKDARID
jgi:hypothetical protein